jgi:hypothetical protein
LIEYTYNKDGSLTANCVTNQWALTETGIKINISSSGSYVMIGCQNGDVNIFKFNLYEGDKTLKIILISVGLLVFVILIATVVYFVKCRNN